MAGHSSNEEQTMRKVIRRWFEEYTDEIVDAVKENLGFWAELPDGPFNTDPLIEPELDHLSENPEYSIVCSTKKDGKRRMWVFFACDATIHCKRYRGNSPDEPLSTTGFAGGVTFTIQVELVVDLASRNVEYHQIGDLAWKKWNNWPETMTR
jgi:hypothetical protein